MNQDVPAVRNFVLSTTIIRLGLTTKNLLDWFGNDIGITKSNDNEKQVNVTVVVSPNAMEHWAMQYINYVEVTAPKSVRAQIHESLQNGIKKYRM